MQVPIAAILSFPEFENDIPEINAAARPFIRRRLRQRLRNTKQRITALDCSKKTLNRKTSRRVSCNYAGSCCPLRHLSNRLYPHACEPTRSQSTLQVRTLASAARHHQGLCTPPIPATPRPC